MSLTIRGWEEGFNAITSAAAYILSLPQRARTGDRAPVEPSPEDSPTRKARKASKYQARGRNPLASPLKNFLHSASKSTQGLFRHPHRDAVTRESRSAVEIYLLSEDEYSDREATCARTPEAHVRPSRPSSLETPLGAYESRRLRSTAQRKAKAWALSSLGSLDLAYDTPEDSLEDEPLWAVRPHAAPPSARPVPWTGADHETAPCPGPLSSAATPSVAGLPLPGTAAHDGSASDRSARLTEPGGWSVHACPDSELLPLGCGSASEDGARGGGEGDALLAPDARESVLPGAFAALSTPVDAGACAAGDRGGGVLQLPLLGWDVRIGWT